MQNNQKRVYTSQFKANLVQEYLRGNKSQVEICRANAINANLLNKWLKQFENNLPLVFENLQKNDVEQKQIEKLEQLIGKQAIAIDFLKRGLQMFS